VSQKSRNPEFKGKYFVRLIGKFKLAIPSDNSGLVSPQQVCGLTLFLHIRSWLFSLCNKQRAISTVQRAFIFEPIKQEYEVHFPDAAVPNLKIISVTLIAVSLRIC
jgi:hypothetical protein